MYNKIILIFVVLIGTSNCYGVLEDIKQVQIFNSLSSKIADKGSFGKTLSNLLEIQLKEENQLDKAIDMVQNLLKQLEQDQIDDDLTYEKKRQMAINAIKDIEENVDILSQQLKETNVYIIDTSKELIELIQSANSLTKQMKILDGKDQELRDNRSFEAYQFNKAKSRTMKILGALKNIINLLTDAVLNEKTSLLEKDELMRQITEELGEDDPVVSMIQITKDFDRDVVVRIIEQLENIRDAIEEIQMQNDRSDQEALQKYEAIVREVNDVSKRLGEDLRVLRKKITKINQDKIVAEKKRDQLQVDVPESQDLLVYNRQQLELQQTFYNTRKFERGKEIEIVWNAYQILKAYKERN